MKKNSLLALMMLLCLYVSSQTSDEIAIIPSLSPCKKARARFR